MENLRNRINAKLLNNEKHYSKCTSKPSYMLHKIFGNNLVAIRKNKLALKLNKPTYIRMCILELSKVLSTNSIMITLKKYESNYYSQILIV